MSLGVDDRSPSSAEASEMMEGWREWHGLTRTAATKRGEREKRRGLFLSWVFGCTRSREQGQKKNCFLLNNATMPLNKNVFMKKKKEKKKSVTKKPEIICNQLQLLSNSENSFTEV